ncbi:MAG: AzlC family ABC transporter permease [Kineosporiaceae bacterium]
MTARDPARAEITRQGLSVGVATGLYGISFGALAADGGLDLAQICVLSLVMFSGGSQFALVGVLSAGGGTGPAVAGAGLLGLRNGLYAVQLSPLLAAGARRVPLAAQLTIDESTAVALGAQARHPDRPQLWRRGFWVTGASVYVCWNAATVLGALAGARLADPRTAGLDGAAAAAFLALVWPRVDTPAARLAAGVAVLAAVALVPLTPAGVPVLGAAVLATAAGVLHDRRQGPTT